MCAGTLREICAKCFFSCKPAFFWHFAVTLCTFAVPLMSRNGCNDQLRRQVVCWQLPGLAENSQL